MEFKLEKVEKFGIHPYFDEEYVQIRFNLNCDLTEVFDWNTHLIFPFISIEYDSEKSKYNQITIWDDIIMRENPEKHNIKLKNKKTEYFISDKYKQLRGRKVRVFFNWEHMPIVGINYRRKIQVGEFTMPSDYTAKPRRY